MSFLRQTGIATDGKIALSGAYEFTSAHDVPLELVLDVFKQSNAVLDIHDYLLSGTRLGASTGALTSRLLSAIGDIYGPEHRRRVEENLTP